MERQDWLRAARRALVRSGPEAVGVEPLARELKVTKGSFYWHFKNREELLECLLQEWEEETRALFRQAEACASPQEALQFLGEYLKKSVASPLGEYPPDVGIFNWAAMCPRIAPRVNRIERMRIDALTRITGRADRAELAYLVWLGFLLRRHRSPGTAADFPLFFEMMLELLSPAKKRKKARRKHV